MEISDIAHDILRRFGKPDFPISEDNPLEQYTFKCAFGKFDFRRYSDGWVGSDDLTISHFDFSKRSFRTVYIYESEDFDEERVLFCEKGEWQRELVALYERLFPQRPEARPRDYSFLEHLDQLELFPECE